MFGLYALLWITFVCSVQCEVCTVTNVNSPVGRECQYGCCTNDDNDTICCEEPFWTWGVVVGIVVAAIVGFIVIVIVILMCIYCKKKKTHTARLRHTVSMRSNRIRPFPDLPSYEDLDTMPNYTQSVQMYDIPPPKYEEVMAADRTNNIPQIQVSSSEPVVSNSRSRNRT